MWELLSKVALLAFLKIYNFLQNYIEPWQLHDRLQATMLFRRSAAMIWAHQEEAIRRRKSGRNSLQADRHRRRTGQAGREDFAKSCLSDCSAQEYRDRRSLRGSRGAGRLRRPQKATGLLKHRPSRQARPALCAGQGRQSCPVDVMPYVISYWVLSGA